jgi:hypothetical protein
MESQDALAVKIVTINGTHLFIVLGDTGRPWHLQCKIKV